MTAILRKGNKDHRFDRPAFVGRQVEQISSDFFLDFYWENL